MHSILEFAEKLSKKYNAKLKEAEDKFYKECDKFGEALDNYREKKGTANKLEYPVNISKPNSDSNNVI